MKTDCAVGKLFQLCEFSEEKLNQVMLTITARALEKLVEVEVKTIIKVNRDGEAEAISTKTMLPYPVTNTKYGKNIEEVFANNSPHDCFVFGASQEGVKSAVNILPRNVIASLSYSSPIDSVEFEDDCYFDTMDAAHPFPDFGKINDWKSTKSISVSVSYDSVKLDMYEAGFLMKYVRKCVEDPDLIHL